MFTTDTAPKGYTGPVRLTPKQRENVRKAEALWYASLERMAADDSDPETQANARALLAARS